MLARDLRQQQWCGRQEDGSRDSGQGVVHQRRRRTRRILSVTAKLIGQRGMGRVPDLIPDSDTGAAEDMVTKTVDRLTADGQPVDPDCWSQ